MADQIASAASVVQSFNALSKEDQKLVLMEVVPLLFRKMDRREMMRFLGEMFAEAAEALA